MASLERRPMNTLADKEEDAIMKKFDKME